MNWLYARRRKIYLALVFLLVVDAAVYVAWVDRPRTPETDPGRIEQLSREVAALAEEVARLERVRAQAPRLRPKIEQFIGRHFLTERAGYSDLAADLEDAAAEAGIVLGRVVYATEEGRGQRVALKRVDITTSVEGNYANLLRYLHRIERAQRFYLIESLTLAGAREGRVRLEVKLSTYLRRLT